MTKFHKFATAFVVALSLGAAAIVEARPHLPGSSNAVQQQTTAVLQHWA